MPSLLTTPLGGRTSTKLWFWRHLYLEHSSPISSGTRISPHSCSAFVPTTSSSRLRSAHPPPSVSARYPTRRRQAGPTVAATEVAEARCMGCFSILGGRSFTRRHQEPTCTLPSSLISAETGVHARW
jgi:hypothetical protein